MEKQYLSVLALNQYIKAKMNQDISLQRIYIKGEISNYRPHPSGHLYFTLKDESSRVAAIMFASQADKLQFTLENGMQVLIEAKVSVYEASGQYQLYVDTIQMDGIGDLYLRFETLKKKLASEGLFDQSYKKPICAYPKSIAVLSAKQGAAVQDVIRTITLRFPFVKVIVFPVPVQGQNAYIKMIDVLTKVDKLGFDTMILTRGGGSLEDLWNFNEEALARCVFACQTPIITGIGHETDFTICDFVSDYRCATPTAAAMKATPDQKELKRQQDHLSQLLFDRIHNRLIYEKQHLNHLQNSYYLTNPESLYTNQYFHFIKLQDQLSYQRKAFHTKSYQKLVQYQKRLEMTMAFKIQQSSSQIQKNIASLDALSPLKVLQRGYSLVKKDNQIIHQADSLKQGDMIDIQFYDSIKKAEIK